MFPGVVYKKQLNQLNRAKDGQAVSLASSPLVMRQGRLPFVDHVGEISIRKRYSKCMQPL